MKEVWLTALRLYVHLKTYAHGVFSVGFPFIRSYFRVLKSDVLYWEVSSHKTLSGEKCCFMSVWCSRAPVLDCISTVVGLISSSLALIACFVGRVCFS